MNKKFKIKISIWQFLALGYLITIFLGSALLIMPFATSDGNSTSYLNALFTATSATCVTGLAPYDTGSHWSLFGQIVILILIQLGGLGFMTFVSTIYLIFKHKVGLYQRNAMLAAAGGDKKTSGISALIKRIFIGTAIFEILGTCLLCIRFVPDYGGARGFYYALFHSVSAFCNAGFDLIGTTEFGSLSRYATDPLVTLTICALIIIGGLGFCVWGDVTKSRCNPKYFQLNTKIVLLVSGLLIIISTVLFILVEWNNPAYAGYNFGEKLLCAIFNATTPRTAGFYTTNPANLSDSGYILTLILMFIGGSSGSTAGGIKVGTFALIIMGTIGAFRGHKDINIGKKRIRHIQLSQALAIFASCLMVTILGAFIICAVDDVTAKEALFECVSALGTCGLTLGITPELGVVSRLILIILMYAGRVGILTLALAIGENHTPAGIRRPVDTLLIG